MANYKMKNIPNALAAILGAAISVSLLMVSSVSAQQPQKVEKIEVTGSNIKRVDVETVAPVEIITREQIERSGVPTVAEVIRNIPSAATGSFNESFSNSFAPGASGVSLRGLGQKTTLVLINGRRTAGYGFAQNIADTFVDLNSIPTAAVERIEILKDGASAIYGSDAIAGVVNVILRNDFHGAEAGANAGRSEGKNEYRANATFGIGDLAKDGYNTFGVVDYYKRGEILQSDTKFLRTRDMRGYAGGRNFQSLTAGGTWRQLTATNGLTNFHRATTDCRFNVITGQQALDQGLIGAISSPGFNQPGNTFCSEDQNIALSALPGSERVGFLGRYTKVFSNTATGYLDLGLGRSKTDQTFTDPFFQSSVLPAGASRPYAYNINFAPGAAGNPFPTNARYVGSLQDMGTRNSEITSDTYRILGGLKYTWGTWDLDSGIGWSKSKVDSAGINRLSVRGVSAAFSVPSTIQPPVPLSTGATYNLDRWTTNTDAVRNSIRLNPTRRSESELKFVDTKASTELWQMAGGAAGLALGGEFRRESLNDHPDASASAGDILGQGITATDARRDNTALYAELGLPFTKRIEGQVAARYDHYSDYGNSTTPKLGLKFHPIDTLLLRANWGRGFRAPTLVENSPSIATFFTQINDPVFNAARNVSGAFAGNKNLKPEKSTSATFGIVWEPVRELSLGVNYYMIDWKNIVIRNCCQRIVNAGDPARVIRDPLTNEIVAVLGGYENQAETKTRGVDFDARYAFKTSVGKLITRANFTYIDSFKEDGVEVVGSNLGRNTLPRTKGLVGLDWDYQAFSVTTNLNYTHTYYQTALTGSFFTPQDARFQNGVYPEKVRHYLTLDLFGRYTINKNLTISASLLNAENKTPPYDPGFSTTNLYDFSLFDIRGRQFRLGFTYKM